MEMNKYKYLSVLLLLLISLSSCNSDNEDEIYDLYYMKLLPSRVVSDGQEVSYSYDFNDKLTQVVYKSVDLSAEYEAQVYRIGYNDNNSIDSLFIEKLKYQQGGSSIDTLGIDTLTFSYGSLQVDVLQKGESIRTLILDANGRLSHREIQNGDELQTFDYTYNSGNAGSLDILSVIQDQGTSTEKTITYTYDEKKGAFKNIMTPQWFLIDFLSINSGFQKNCLTEGNTTYTYTYSENNYPRISTTNEGTTVSIDYVKANYYASSN